MSKFRLVLPVILLTVMAILMTVQPIAAQSGCFDASGASIPCPSTPAAPSDRDFDSVEDALDHCPDQGGDVGNHGCPLPEATEDTTGAGINPTRPNPTGQCSLTAYATVAVNVRATPNMNAPVVEVLDPAQVYVVHAAVVVDGAVWYRVDSGWVSSAAVVVDGDCAASNIEVERNIAQLDAGIFDEELEGIIFPETECFVVFNGIRICQTVLSAALDEDSTAGKWDVNVCGFGPSGVICTLLTFSVPDDAECPPEFCEPAPSGGGNSGGGSGGSGGNGGNGGSGNGGNGNGGNGGSGNGGNGGSGNGNAPMCVDLLNSLSAASSANGVNPAVSTEQTADGSVRFTLNTPPSDPQPCIYHLFVPQLDEASNGVIPVDRIAVQLEILPDEPINFFEINVAETDGMPHVRVFNGMSTTPDGNTCIPMVHGDFTYCSIE